MLKPFYQKLPSIPKSMSSLATGESRISESKISHLFDQYKDSLEDNILAEGIENLCNDLQLNPDEFKVLVLAWKLNASQMCRFTRQEFILGLKNMRTDSIKGIQVKLNEITNELKRDSEQFKDLYRFTFKFGLDISTGQRILPADIAVVLWRLVFTNNEPPILSRWLSYLEKNPHIRGIPKDTWYMFLNFCDTIGDDLSTYDDAEAWPSLFDDFVEYENDQMNQNITKNDLKMQN
ncbi:DCN1-like protein 3 [Eumeta japonica]|uniref:Defective in cullin neddylation protein n=1 Tax=Eumeta variegata TaxID=151549 RepID=A0A4C1VS66_EUMVA|nr:DCN1-like protein 3 [Eumeta japonica]